MAIADTSLRTEKRTMAFGMNTKQVLSDRYTYGTRAEMEEMIKKSIDNDKGTYYTVDQVREELARMR